MQELLEQETPSQEETSYINFWKEELEQAATSQILDWAFDNYHPRLALAVSPGLSSSVLVAMIAERYPMIDMFFVDTGYHFPETFQYLDDLREKYDVDIRYTRSRTPISDFEWNHGFKLYHHDPELCCRERKENVFREIAANYDAVICGARRDQIHDKSSLPIIEWDENLGSLRVAPLVRWGQNELWTKIKRENIPYNKLYDYGFERIECLPCTLPMVASRIKSPYFYET